MTEPEAFWYVIRLGRIPSSPVSTAGLLDQAEGAAECRRIGQEIQNLHGPEGLAEVSRLYRETVDAAGAAKIEQIWAALPPRKA
jgi:hypothetical protein